MRSINALLKYCIFLFSIAQITLFAESPTRGGLSISCQLSEDNESLTSEEILAYLRASQQYWPKKVKNRIPLPLPIKFNGRDAGNLVVPPFTEFAFKGVAGQNIIVDYGGTEYHIPYGATDLMELFHSMRRQPVSNLHSDGSPGPDVEAELNPELRNERVHKERPRKDGYSNFVSVGVLERSGGNRQEIAKALAQVDGRKKQQLELLLAYARQFDLANLTSEHLLHTLDYTLKAREEMPWARLIPNSLWDEYVLPYRVADEDLDDWRPEFYSELAPIVKIQSDSKSAALKVHQWLYKGSNGAARIKFEVSDNRDQTPRQLLKQTKVGRCFEMNLLLVALLRSVGIPARHAGVAYWRQTDQYHYWVEYWDTSSKRWMALEPNVNPDAIAARKSPFSVAYGFPGYSSISDIIGKERWGAFENISANYARTGSLELRCSEATDSNPCLFTVYSWNSSAWRSVATFRGVKAMFILAINETGYPYLVSASVNGKIAWTWTRILSDKTEIVSLNPALFRAEATMVEFKRKTNTPKK